MKPLQELVRPNIWNLVPYSCARDEFQGSANVWLDANESPYNAPYNRYPDPLQREVKALLTELRGVDADRIFLGVGSDECIDTVYRVFCRPGIDAVVAMSPSYGMYEVCADVNDVEYRRVPLNDDFSLNVDAILAAAEDAKVIWICSPNNPTGNAFPLNEIADLCNRFDGIVVVDEAYIDFSAKGSALTLLNSQSHDGLYDIYEWFTLPELQGKWKVDVAFLTCGTSTIVVSSSLPLCPPASKPSATTASTPASSHFLAKRLLDTT